PRRLHRPPHRRAIRRHARVDHRHRAAHAPPGRPQTRLPGGHRRASRPGPARLSGARRRAAVPPSRRRRTVRRGLGRRRRVPVRLSRYRFRVAAVAVCLTVLCVLAGAASARVYHGVILTGLVAGAALGAFAIGFLLRNKPSWLSAAVSFWGLAACLLVSFALTSDGTEPLPQVVVDALVNAVPRTLTALIPVEPAPDTVGVPVFLTWLAAGLSCEFAVRYGRTLLGCLPPTLLYAAGLYLVGPNAGPAVAATVAYCLVAGVALAV